MGMHCRIFVVRAADSLNASTPSPGGRARLPKGHLLSRNRRGAVVKAWQGEVRCRVSGLRERKRPDGRPVGDGTDRANVVFLQSVAFGEEARQSVSK